MEHKKKKEKNQYFTKEHENAILRYVASKDINERTKLYVDFIEPSLSEMVEKITFTYKFTSLPNINYLKKECKIWLTTILDKFDVSKGSKAFSYFSIITKNWFIAKTKKNASQSFKEIRHETLPKDLESKYFSSENKYMDLRQEGEFWLYLVNEVSEWENKSLKDNERKVLEAIGILMNSVEEIDIFNKKAIYFFLREITGLSTKQIVNNLNKYRTKYKDFKRKWDNGII
ncbi:MAG: hypothetical protein Q8P81_01500 [Nanoarchaeota archaeon]|nr:hypothetical protein [Nanoarchaeota archaeon]